MACSHRAQRRAQPARGGAAAGAPRERLARAGGGRGRGREDPPRRPRVRAIGGARVVGTGTPGRGDPVRPGGVRPAVASAGRRPGPGRLRPAAGPAGADPARARRAACGERSPDVVRGRARRPRPRCPRGGRRRCARRSPVVRRGHPRAAAGAGRIGDRAAAADRGHVPLRRPAARSPAAPGQARAAAIRAARRDHGPATEPARDCRVAHPSPGAAPGSLARSRDL